MEDQVELERRYLVNDRAILDGSTGNLVEQAYLFSVDGYVVRVRRTHIQDERGVAYDGPAFITAKGPRLDASREEYESEIPVHFAAELIARCDLQVRKVRHQIVSENGAWDVDVFLDQNEGLVVAEFEARDVRSVRAPWWCGDEVTGDRRYDNESLAAHPFQSWDDKPQGRPAV